MAVTCGLGESRIESPLEHRLLAQIAVVASRSNSAEACTSLQPRPRWL